MKKKVVFGGLVLVFFLIILTIGFYNRGVVLSDGVSINAIAIKPDGYRVGRFKKDWKLVYLIGNKPYYAHLTGNLTYGDNVSLRYSKSNPNRYIIGDKVAYDKSEERILLLGLNFPSNLEYKVFIYSGENFLKELTFKESFGSYVNYNPEISIFFESNGKVINNKKYQMNSVRGTNFVIVDYSKW